MARTATMAMRGGLKSEKSRRVGGGGRAAAERGAHSKTNSGDLVGAGAGWISAGADGVTDLLVHGAEAEERRATGAVRCAGSDGAGA